jgi:hypothetical protein
VVALLLPAVTTWAVIRNTSERRSEAEVRFHIDLQRQLDRQARELQELRITVESQDQTVRSLDRELDQIMEAVDDPS